MQHKPAIPAESVIEQVSPHVLGMYPLYAVWAYPVLLGALFMYPREAWIPVVAGKLNHLLDAVWGNPLVAKLARDWAFTADHTEAYLTCWVAALLLPGLLLAVARISLRWLFIVGLTAAAGLGARFASPLGDHASPYFVNNAENVVLIAIGVLGILGTELYRRSHRYLVTDRRIIIRSGAGGQERSIFYGHIDDLVMTRPLLGSLFGFGTIIPVTGSGLGLGEDEAGGVLMAGTKVGRMQVAAGVTGSRSEKVLRPSLSQTLFNVPDPERLYELIVGQVAQRA